MIDQTDNDHYHPTTPESKLLYRLLCYLENNRTWHTTNVNHNGSTGCGVSESLPPQPEPNGMTLPMNAMVWFVQHYIEYHQQQQQQQQGGDDDDDDDEEVGHQRASTNHQRQQQYSTNDDPNRFFQQIVPLVPYCTKLRITSQPWHTTTTTTTEDVPTLSEVPTIFVTSVLQQRRRREVRGGGRRDSQGHSSSLSSATLRQRHDDDNSSNSNNIVPVVTNMEPTPTASKVPVVATKYMLDLIQCISYIFPKLHSLWFDQINHDNDDTIKIRPCRRSENCNVDWMESFIRTKTTTNSLSVLRIDLIQMDDHNNNKNLTYTGSATSGYGDPTPIHKNDSSNGGSKSDRIDFPHLIHLQCTSSSSSNNNNRTLSSSASLSYNGPHLWMETFPNLQSLCLSHNQIQMTAIDVVLRGLCQLPYLHYLDLSYNHIVGLPNAQYQLGQIITLNVSHNCMQSVNGIDRLVSLQTLHINHNQLYDLHNTASRLANLPVLKDVYIEGNPFCYRPERQMSLTHVVQNDHRDTDSNSRRDVKATTRRQSPTLYPYHVDIWTAFIVRRISIMYKTKEQRQQLTIRNVIDDLIPTIDGTIPTQRQWYVLRNRIFLPIDSPPHIQHSIHNNKNDNTTTTIQHLKSYSSQSHINSSIRHVRRGLRHKPRRTIVSIDNAQSDTNPTIVSGDTVDGTRDLDDARINNRPNPAFSVHDVMNSLCLQSDLPVVTHSNIPPTIKCLHQTVLLPSTLISTNDQKYLLDFNENIGQLYLDSIHMAPVSSRKSDGRMMDIQKSFEPAFDDIHSFNVQPTVFKVNVNSVHSVSARQQICLGTSSDLSTIHDPDATIHSRKKKHEDNISHPHENASTENSVQTTETMEIVSVCRDSIDSSSSSAKFVPETLNMSSDSAVGVSVVDGAAAATSSQPESPQQQMTVLVSSFSESQLQDDSVSLPSDFGLTNGSPVGKSSVLDRSSKSETFQLAEKNSTYVGPKTYQNLRIRDNLELYFRLFVFSPAVPTTHLNKSQPDDNNDSWRVVLQRYSRIQLWPVDRVKREETFSRRTTQVGGFDIRSNITGDQLETFRRVWKEKIVGCGRPALRRITPSRVSRYGFHGELLWSAAEASQIQPEAVVECREAICCLSDTSFYIMVDHDTVTCKPQKMPRREFPIPIPELATFKDSKWPHAMVCHSLDKLRRITIGFGFQRLILHFDNLASSNDNAYYVYVLLTCNKLETIALLKEFQDLTNTEADFGLDLPSVQRRGVPIENDDPLVLDALGFAVAPDMVGVVLHYQVLQQKWKSGGRGKVRRVCVVTDSKVYLLDEDYVGDGSDSVVTDGTNGGITSQGKVCRNSLGSCLYRLVDSAELDRIEYVAADDTDPNSVTIVMKPITRLTRRRNWRLQCRDRRQGAERLVEDLRKAISLL